MLPATAYPFSPLVPQRSRVQFVWRSRVELAGLVRARDRHLVTPQGLAEIRFSHPIAFHGEHFHERPFIFSQLEHLYRLVEVLVELFGARGDEVAEVLVSVRQNAFEHLQAFHEAFRDTTLAYSFQLNVLFDRLTA